MGRGDATSFSITPEKTKVNVSALFCTFVAKKTQRGMLLILLWGVLKTKFFNQVEKFIDFHTHKDNEENTNIIFPNKKYVFALNYTTNLMSYTDLLAPYPCYSTWCWQWAIVNPAIKIEIENEKRR